MSVDELKLIGGVQRFGDEGTEFMSIDDADENPARRDVLMKERQCVIDAANRLAVDAAMLKFNPYHDDAGRFSSGGGGVNVHSAPDTGGSYGGGGTKHRHTNPDGTVGGWVADTAKVAKTVYVSKGSKVYDNAEVSGNVRIEGKNKVYGNAKISGKVYLDENAEVYGNAKISGKKVVIFGNAKIYENAKVSDEAKIFGNAEVHGNAKISGKALISGNADIAGNKIVSGNTQISEREPLSDIHIQINDKFNNYVDTVVNGSVAGKVKFKGSVDVMYKVSNAMDIGDGMKKLGVSADKARAFLSKVKGEHSVAQNKAEHGKASVQNLAASELIGNWAKSSGDHDVVSLAIQKSAEKVMKLKNAANSIEVYDAGGNRAKKVNALLKEHGDVIDAFVKSTYQNTQKQLNAAGVKEMFLYRGVSEKLTSKNIKANPLTSFSTSFDVANDFAEMRGGGGSIMAVKVKAKDIFSTYTSGNGCSKEKEVVILGGRLKAERVGSGDKISSHEDFWKSIGNNEQLQNIYNIDANISDADWPKRTDDRLSTLMELPPTPNERNTGPRGGPELKGDKPGHSFRGNQWDGGSNSSSGTSGETDEEWAARMQGQHGKPETKPKPEPKPKPESKPGYQRPTEEEWQQNLTEENRNALWAYTGNDYKKIRGCQNRGVGCTKAIKGHIQALTQVMNDAPKYDGGVHRGIWFRGNGSRDKFLAGLQKNGGLVTQGFTSTSSSIKIANHFSKLRPNAASVIISVRTKSGVDISKIARRPNEKEVLIPPSTKWRLVGMEKQSDGSVFVSMEEE